MSLVGKATFNEVHQSPRRTFHLDQRTPPHTTRYLHTYITYLHTTYLPTQVPEPKESIHYVVSLRITVNHAVRFTLAPGRGAHGVVGHAGLGRNRRTAARRTRAGASWRVRPLPAGLVERFLRTVHGCPLWLLVLSGRPAGWVCHGAENRNCVVRADWRLLSVHGA